MQESNLQKIHAVLLFMAEEFDRICKANNIKYTVDGGTMIGIIRHKGFIPWDDDLDIHMLREDYQRLLRIMEDQPDYRFKIVNWNNSGNYYHGHAKFVLIGSEVIQQNHKQSDESRELFIDIFPYDNAPKGFVRQMEQKWRCYLLNKAIVLDGNFKTSKGTLNRILDWLVKVYTKNQTREELISRIEKCAQKYNNRQTENVAYMTGSKKGYEHTLSPRTMHEDVVYLPFENIELLCAKEYDYLLKLQFGEYMIIPPVEKRANHKMELTKLPEYLQNLL